MESEVRRYQEIVGGLEKAISENKSEEGERGEARDKLMKEREDEIVRKQN